MVKKIIDYVGSQIGVVTKEGPNQGQQYYSHAFLLGNATFNVIEYKNEYGLYPIKSALDNIGAERLTSVNAEFELYVNINGYLSVRLKGIERIQE